MFRHKLSVVLSSGAFWLGCSRTISQWFPYFHTPSGFSVAFTYATLSWS